MSEQADTEEPTGENGRTAHAAETSAADEGEQNGTVRDPYFDRALKGPTIAALARARAYTSPFLTTDAELRRVGDYYYPRLLAAFDRIHPDGNFSVFDRVHIGMELMEDRSLRVTVTSSSIRFDWTQAQAALLRISRLIQDIRTWVRVQGPRPSRWGIRKWFVKLVLGSEDDGTSGSDGAAGEQTRLLAASFGLATMVGGALNNENTLHRSAKKLVPEAPTEAHIRSLDALYPEIESLERRFKECAERQALSDYARGMAFGVMACAILAGMVFGVIAIVEAPAFYGVALPAGALGAAVSVLRRMYKGQMKVEYRTPRLMLIMYGALRPFVGGVFGALVFAVFLAGLVPNVVVPRDHGTLIAWYAVFGFIGGFSERFAQDMLQGATNVLPDRSLDIDV